MIGSDTVDSYSTQPTRQTLVQVESAHDLGRFGMLSRILAAFRLRDILLSGVLHAR